MRQNTENDQIEYLGIDIKKSQLSDLSILSSTVINLIPLFSVTLTNTSLKRKCSRVIQHCVTFDSRVLKWDTNIKVILLVIMVDCN